MTESYAHIPDTNQNFWQLACIQSTALGLPGMLIGGQLAQRYGAGTAIISVCIGNLILWGLAYTIVSMSLISRTNAIENIKKYVGTWPCIVGSLILTIGFLSWTMEQNTVFMEAIGSFAKWDSDTQTSLGVVALCVIAFLSFGTIRLIKKVCVYALPFLLLFTVYQSIFSCDNYSEIIKGPWNLSFFAVVAIVAQNLTGVVNLPTFFRHARSKQDALVGLALITCLVSVFQIFSILVGIASPLDFFSRTLSSDSGLFGYAFSVVFVIASTLCVNLVNIYFASAGWEAISNLLRSVSSTWKSELKAFLRYVLVPRSSKYATALGLVCVINGLLASIFYQVFQNFKQIEFLQVASNNGLATLWVVLMLAFLTKIFEKHRPRLLERTVSGTSWFIGGFVAIYTQIKSLQGANQALIAGIIASSLAYISAIFIEAALWAMGELFRRKVRR